MFLDYLTSLYNSVDILLFEYSRIHRSLSLLLSLNLGRDRLIFSQNIIVKRMIVLTLSSF